MSSALTEVVLIHYVGGASDHVCDGIVGLVVAEEAAGSSEGGCVAVPLLGTVVVEVTSDASFTGVYAAVLCAGHVGALVCPVESGW